MPPKNFILKKSEYIRETCFRGRVDKFRPLIGMAKAGNEKAAGILKSEFKLKIFTPDELKKAERILKFSHDKKGKE